MFCFEINPSKVLVYANRTWLIVYSITLAMPGKDNSRAAKELRRKLPYECRQKFVVDEAELERRRLEKDQWQRKQAEKSERSRFMAAERNKKIRELQSLTKVERAEMEKQERSSAPAASCSPVVISEYNHSSLDSSIKSVAIGSNILSTPEKIYDHGKPAADSARSSIQTNNPSTTSAVQNLITSISNCKSSVSGKYCIGYYFKRIFLVIESCFLLYKEKVVMSNLNGTFNINGGTPLLMKGTIMYYIILFQLHTKI